MNEIELMQRVGSGDGEAIARFVDIYYDSIFRFLRHATGSREDAQDLAQDVFVIARAKGKTFSGASSLRTWLTRVALNEYSKHRRKAAIRAAWPWRPPPTAVSADSMIDSEWLLAGLCQLSSEHRIALLLYEVQGFSVKEVAAITHCPEGTVKARLHYARKRLREILVCPEGVENGN
jgi:RNA polymerase sigma-70 factor (ECF subfamily)